MSEKQRAPFKSGTTDYAAIKKRMDELGILREQPGATNGVDVTTTKTPESKPEPGFYY